MKKLIEYIIQQLILVPQTIYEVLLLLFIISAIVYIALYGKRAAKYVSGLLLGEYIFIIYGLTVIYRSFTLRLNHVFIPFWSYKGLLKGEMPPLLYEMIMNLVLFIPAGLLLGTQITKRTTRQQWVFAFLLGLVLSLSIEVLQLVFQRGSFEIDDIIHNTVGCLMGFAIWRGCAKLIVAIKSHNGNNRQETA